MSKIDWANVAKLLAPVLAFGLLMLYLGTLI